MATVTSPSAILISPLTNDKSALKMYLESLSPNAVSTQGTDFKKALSEACSMAEQAHAMYRSHPDWPSREKLHAALVLGAVLPPTNP